MIISPPKTILGLQGKETSCLLFLNTIQLFFISASEASMMFCLPLCYLHICEQMCPAPNQGRFKIFFSKTDSIGLQKGTITCQPPSLPLYAGGECCRSILDMLLGGKNSGSCLGSRMRLWPTLGQVGHGFARWVLETLIDGDFTTSSDMFQTHTIHWWINFSKYLVWTSLVTTCKYFPLKF